MTNGVCCCYLIFRVEQFQLIVHQSVLGGLFLAESALLLELRAPECLDAVHGAAQLLVGQLQLLLQVGEVPLQVRVGALQLLHVELCSAPSVTQPVFTITEKTQLS